MIAADPTALENAPETAAYRHTLRRIWELLRQRYESVKREAQARGSDVARAQIEAAAALRGDLRTFLSELLTRASATAIIDFLAAAPAWGEAGELLFESQSAVVLRLVENVYPAAMLGSVAPLERDTAADERTWSAWVSAWSAELIKQDARAKPLLKGSANASPSAWRWVPWIAGGVVLVGGTAALVVRRSRRRSAAPRPKDVDPQRLLASVHALARRHRQAADQELNGQEEGDEEMSHEDL